MEQCARQCWQRDVETVQAKVTSSSSSTSLCPETPASRRSLRRLRGCRQGTACYTWRRSAGARASRAAGSLCSMVRAAATALLPIQRHARRLLAVFHDITWCVRAVCVLVVLALSAPGHSGDVQLAHAPSELWGADMHVGQVSTAITNAGYSFAADGAGMAAPPGVQAGEPVTAVLKLLRVVPSQQVRHACLRC
jgi:hypothetical protein